MKKLSIVLTTFLLAISTTFIHARMKPGMDTTKNKHVKADGSADKRFKENRKVKPVIIPTKKDGTPDMRYKTSKAAKPGQ